MPQCVWRRPNVTMHRELQTRPVNRQGRPAVNRAPNIVEAIKKAAAWQQPAAPARSAAQLQRRSAAAPSGQPDVQQQPSGHWPAAEMRQPTVSRLPPPPPPLLSPAAGARAGLQGDKTNLAASPPPHLAASDSRNMLEAFFVGRALAEVLNERLGAALGDALAEFGKWDAETRQSIRWGCAISRGGRQNKACRVQCAQWCAVCGCWPRSAGAAAAPPVACPFAQPLPLSSVGARFSTLPTPHPRLPPPSGSSKRR